VNQARRMTASDYAELGISVPEHMEDNAARDCPVGSCQRHGLCMYLNHPRCPLVRPDAADPRFEREACSECGDETGECGCG
jgi:hypothetical protein